MNNNNNRDMPFGMHSDNRFSILADEASARLAAPLVDIMEKTDGKVFSLSEDAIVTHTSHNTYTVNIERTVHIGRYSYSINNEVCTDITPSQDIMKPANLEDMLKLKYRSLKKKKIDRKMELVAKHIRETVYFGMKYPVINRAENLTLEEYREETRLLQEQIDNGLIDKAIVEVEAIKKAVEDELLRDGMTDKVTVQAGDAMDDSVHSNDYTIPIQTEWEKRMYHASLSDVTTSSLHTLILDILDKVEDSIDDNTLKYVKMLEHVLLFWYLDVPNMTNKAQAMIRLYRLASNITGYSVCDAAFSWVNKILNEYNSVSVQSGVMPDLSVTDIFQKFMSSDAYKHIQKLVCALCTVVLTQTILKRGKNMDDLGKHSEDIFGKCWSHFQSKLIKHVGKSFDVCTTVLEFCSWFLSRGMEIIQGKATFESVFFSENGAQQFDERVGRLQFTQDCLNQGLEEVTLDAYMHEILDLEVLCKKEFDAQENKIMKVTLQRQLQYILSHKSEMIRMLSSRSTRASPFAVLLHGTTSTGKTTVGSIIVPLLQEAMGVKKGPEYVYNLDTNDKYMSGMSYEKNTIIMDDLANTMPNLAEKNAGDFVIYLINNYKRWAVMADIESKGRIPLDPAIVLASTNCPELHSQVTSIEPLSILRRFEYHIEVKVKPSCGTGPIGRLMMKNRTEHCPDDHGYNCWELSFSRYENSSDPAIKLLKVPIPNLQSVDLSTAMIFLVEQAKAHKEAQSRLVHRMNTIHLSDICRHSIFSYMCTTCRSEREDVEKANSQSIALSNVEQQPIEVMSGSSLDGPKVLFDVVQQADKFTNWCRSLGKPPVKKKDNISMSRFAKFMMSIRLWNKQKIAPWQVGLLAVSSCCLAPVGALGGAAYCGAWLLTNASLYACTSIFRISSYMRITPYDTVVSAVKAVRRDWRKHLVALKPLMIVVGVSFASYKLWKYCYEKKMETQGCIESLPIPNSVTGRRDPYRPPAITVPLINIDTRTSTSDQIAKVIQSRLCVFRFKKQNVHVEHCSSMPVCTGYWLVPYHILLKNYDEIEIVKHNTLHVNSTRHTRLDSSMWKRIGLTDYCVVYIPQLGDQKDMRNYFPTNHISTNGVGCKCVWMKAKAELIGEETYISVERGDFTTNLQSTMVRAHGIDFSYLGGQYRSAIPTWRGMCGNVLVTDVNGPTIVGLHSAGAEGTIEARTCSILRDELKTCIAAMSGDESSQFMGVQSGNFSECLDFKKTNFQYIDTQRPKATTTFVDKGSFEVLGSFTAPHRTFRSKVKPTIISETASAILLFDIKHGAPKYINHWSPWNSWISAMSTPSDIPSALVDLAYRDMKKNIFDNWQPDWNERIHPLSEDAVLAGVDGLKGCYAMNMKSSMGIPYCKPKNQFLSQSTRVVENISCPRDMPQHLRDEIEQMEETLASGQRVYVPHRCSLKDEPTKFSKDKVRIFMGTMFAYQYLMRKYFLMISVITQEHPEIFESAVGVNASSMEWTRMHKHIFKHGRKRCIAGDFKNYDQKIDGKITLAFMKILVLMAKRAGYSVRQLTICDGLVIETCMGVFDVKNEILQFNCGVPAGNSLTVVLNGGSNRLQITAAFYALRPSGETRCFAEIVSLMTYGDDNVMTVVEGCDWFNHTAIANKLAEWGMTYTMADKDSVSVPFISSDEVDFLKRKWVWSEDYQRYLCPLDEDSIFKSLSCAIKSEDLTDEAHSAAIVSNANMEYWFHGKEVFDKRHAQLRDVLTHHKIEHHIPGGRLKSYEDLEQWYLEN